MSTTMKYGHLSEKEKLRWELESLRQERDAALNTFHSANKERLELREENSRFREALLWYAEFGGTTAMDYDFGAVARKALNQPKP